MNIVKNDLFDYENRYIFQDINYFKFSLDSILLAEFTKIENKDNLILDMCSGNAVIPLILSTKTQKKIIGFEIQEDIYDLAVKSINYNNLQNQITLINDDIKNINNYYKNSIFSTIICNPPFFKINEDGYVNDNVVLAIARHEIKINLEEIFIIVNKMLKSKGSFFLVHRASRIDDIIYLSRINNVPVKEIQFIATKNDDKPYIVLVKCVKDAKPGIIINKIINVNKLKTYKDIFKGGKN